MAAQASVSPLAPPGFPAMPPVRGVRLACGAAEIRYRNRTDVLLVELDRETTVAGVFTRSRTAAAPVLWCRRALSGGVARALIVNAGNANACTGAGGDRVVERTVIAAAELFDCPSSQVFVGSTGVIGQPLPVEKIERCLPRLADRVADNGWEEAARTIMTTDTFAKGASRQATIDGRTVTINGIAKGSGMIAPDMATLLAYVFTDAAIPAPVLQALLEAGTDLSFNCITVDGDSSTNDSLMLFATGGAGHDPVTAADDPRLQDFRSSLNAVLIDLAQQIVKDGEGASKFVTVAVTGAESDRAARVIALKIANSPLVKTAIAGEDANWGRILMAVGNAGERIDPERLAVRLGGFPVAAAGGAIPGYDETPVARVMKDREIEIAVDVGVGAGTATVWTCDLTHAYIDINASYRS
jgi:glutamate N-acetyltransferase/amino-acid N-acetyltransferase